MSEPTSPAADENAPLTPEALLLLASLERPLTAAEAQQLKAAAQASAEFASDVTLARLLSELRTEARLTRHAARAWQDFRRLADAQPARRGQAWFARLRLALPAFATLLILVQAGGLAWLASRPAPQPEMRGNAASAACPALLVHFKPETGLAEVTRVLLQSGARISDGPDAAGRFRISGPATFMHDAPALLGPLSDALEPARDCAAD